MDAAAAEIYALSTRRSSDLDLRHAERGGGVLPGGVVADVHPRSRHLVDEVREAAVPEFGIDAGVSNGTSHAGRLFTEIGRVHVCTPVTVPPRMPSSA